MWKFDDVRMPTDAERKKLARLMYLAFVDIRKARVDYLKEWENLTAAAQ